MSRTRSLKNRSEMYRGNDSRQVAITYSITVTWPSGRISQMQRRTKSAARELAEDVELKGANVKVVEWRGSQPTQLAVLDAFAKRPGLPAGASHADKLAAVRADLTRLAAQTPGRLALQ